MLLAQVERRPLLGKIQTRQYFFKEANSNISYTLFVPSDYTKVKKTPMLVVLHGLFGNPWQMIGTDGLVQQAEKDGFIVVCPMGYNETGWYGSRGTGQMFPLGPKNHGALSEKDVMNVVGIMRREFNVDPKRMYLSGHSMGGAGTFYLAAKHPDLWAGLAPIAPALHYPGIMRDLGAIRHLPVILVQGDGDWLCPAKHAKKCARKMLQLKMDVRYLVGKGENHLSVTWKHWPEIFEFLKARRRK